MCVKRSQNSGWGGGDSREACAVEVLLSCALKGWVRIPRETVVSESIPDSINGTERTWNDGGRANRVPHTVLVRT